MEDTTSKKVVFIGNTKMYYKIQHEDVPANALPFVVANLEYDGLIPRHSEESTSKAVELTPEEKRKIEEAERVFVVADLKPEFLNIFRMLVDEGFDVTSKKFVMVTNAESDLKSFDTMGEGSRKVKIKEALKGKFIGTLPEDVEKNLEGLYPETKPEKLKQDLAAHRSKKTTEAAVAKKRNSGEASPTSSKSSDKYKVAHEKVVQCKHSFDESVRAAHAEYEKIAVLNKSIKDRQEAGESNVPVLETIPAYQESAHHLKALALEINTKAELVETEAREDRKILKDENPYTLDEEKFLEEVLANTREKAVLYMFCGAALSYDEIKEIAKNPGLSPAEKIRLIKEVQGNLEKLAASSEQKVEELKVLMPKVIAKIDDEDKKAKAKTALSEKIKDWDEKLRDLQQFKIKSKTALANVIAMISVGEITKTPALISEAKEHIAAARREIAEFERLFVRANDEKSRVLHRNMVALATRIMIDILHLESRTIDVEKAVYDSELEQAKERYAGFQREVERRQRDRVVADDIVPQLAALKVRAEAIDAKAAACVHEVEKEFAQFNAVIGEGDGVVDPQTRACVTRMEGDVVALGESTRGNVESINKLHREEAAKIDQKVSFFVQDGIVLDRDAISRNVVAQNSEVICVYFDSRNAVEFSNFWNEALVRHLKAAKDANSNVQILFLSASPLHADMGEPFPGFNGDPREMAKERIASVQVDGFHIADPVFVEDVEDFKTKARNAADNPGSVFVAAPAPALVPVAVAPQQSFFPSRKDYIRHSRFERQAALTQELAADQVDADWLALQAKSLQNKWVKKQHATGSTLKQITSNAKVKAALPGMSEAGIGDDQVFDALLQRANQADPQRYKVVSDLLALLTKEEERWQPKVKTFFANQFQCLSRAQAYVKERHDKKELIIRVAKGMYTWLKNNPGQLPMGNEVNDILRDCGAQWNGHVQKAIVKIIREARPDEFRNANFGFAMRAGG